jgi:hypothetical protein
MSSPGKGGLNSFRFALHSNSHGYHLTHSNSAINSFVKEDLEDIRMKQQISVFAHDLVGNHECTEYCEEIYEDIQQGKQRYATRLLTFVTGFGGPEMERFFRMHSREFQKIFEEKFLLYYTMRFDVQNPYVRLNSPVQTYLGAGDASPQESLNISWDDWTGQRMEAGARLPTSRPRPSAVTQAECSDYGGGMYPQTCPAVLPFKFVKQSSSAQAAGGKTNVSETSSDTQQVPKEVALALSGIEQKFQGMDRRLSDLNALMEKMEQLCVSKNQLPTVSAASVEQGEHADSEGGSQEDFPGITGEGNVQAQVASVVVPPGQNETEQPAAILNDAQGGGMSTLELSALLQESTPAPICNSNDAVLSAGTPPPEQPPLMNLSEMVSRMMNQAGAAVAEQPVSPLTDSVRYALPGVDLPPAPPTTMLDQMRLLQRNPGLAMLCFPPAQGQQRDTVRHEAAVTDAAYGTISAFQTEPHEPADKEQTRGIASMQV